ncbi:probable glutamate receptor [Panulirus ornatus]|uniref:probable glutamate receptor n=1 Tax=Panulirus ornatus TaxID=150431 RepID=UPI003A87FA37
MDGIKSAQDECLKVVALDWSPLTKVMTSEPPHRVVGVMVKIMDIFANHLNFCYQVIVPPHGDWGRKVGHNNYSGLIGYINRGEAAVTMVPLTITPLRAEAMAFSEPLFNNEQRVIYKRPVPEAQVLGFVKPYTPMVWMWILFSLLVLCVAVCLVHLATSSLHDHLLRKSSIFLHLFPVGCDRAAVPWWPESWSVRVVAGMWLLVSLIVGGVYRSNLKAMLILPTVSLPFDNIRQLLHTDIPTYVILGSIFDHAMLAAPKNSPLGRLKKQTMVHGNIKAAIADIHAGNIAAVASYSGLQDILHESFSRASLHQGIDLTTDPYHTLLPQPRYS